MKIFTIGSTKTTAKEFFERLKVSGATWIIDVRLHNRSQLSGFAKRDDLAFFSRSICGIGYTHLTSLAPTKEISEPYRKRRMTWLEYQFQFLDLMKKRRIEKLDRSIFNDACLLCSEDKPHHCHRRLVAEYLRQQWGNIQIQHL